MKDKEYIKELEAIVCALAWHYREAKRDGYSPFKVGEFEAFANKAAEKAQAKVLHSNVPIQEVAARFFPNEKVLP